MDQNGDCLKAEIKTELSRHFKSVDESIGSYIIEVVDGNKDDFNSASDVYDAVGAFLNELSNGDKSEDDLNEICKRFYQILKGDSDVGDDNDDDNNNNRIEQPNGPHHIQKLSAPVTIRSTADDNGQFEVPQSILEMRKGGVGLIDPRKVEKADARIKQKQERRDAKEAKSTTQALVYDSVALASASQVINKKLESQKENDTNRSFDIVIENFDISFGNKSLLSGADLQLAFGRRYCLIGRNGIGKTTLLKMISSAQLKIPPHIRILHVEQEVQGDDTPAIESVLECDIKRQSLLSEEKVIHDKLNASDHTNDQDLSKRLTEIYIELETIEADKAPSRAAKILCGLGFEPNFHTRPTKEFSGGWRMRLALARALFAKPDLLLLDEPTNMLDLKAIIWLENYLQNWATTLLIVSHDRSFLNAVATDILHLHTQKIVPYRGNYENFLKTRNENLKNQQREYEAQLEYRQHIQIFIDRFRYNANRASQVQSKIKLLEKLPELTPIEKEKEVHFKFPEPDHLNGTILQLDEIDFYYTKDRYIFRNVDISATMDSRICVVGENGSGKTTLLKILLGELEPVKGLRHQHRSLRIGYFAQHHIDALTMNFNSVELMQTRFPGRNIEEYRAELGKFGVTGDMALQPIISLSGGQKSRVAFAIMAFQNPNFMILDEPTNHLDMETIEALGEALNAFKGGIILVSHDERLIQLICKELWLARDNKVTSIPGGYEQYRKLIEKELEY